MIFPVRGRNQTYEDFGEGEVGGELGDAKAARGGASEIKGEGEGGEHHLDWELEQVDHLQALAIFEELALTSANRRSYILSVPFPIGLGSPAAVSSSYSHYYLFLLLPARY